MFLVPIFTKINLLVALIAIMANIMTKRDVIAIANSVVGSPKTFDTG